MIKLTDEQRKKYIESKGTKCPLCRSDQLEGSSIEIDAGYAWQPITCLDCKACWNDIYNLVDIQIQS